ncbi:hypothetical protein [Methanoregula sp.]|uniref:hypothetical protein n=1 Tax=Methanoregula sp. TaxID=2052170 RepID=UPI0023744FD7|nr:hypothetical protein [Methanoregula sp.]MDD1685646.1 hypothetical protein [Methanoregula sp.]
MSGDRQGFLHKYGYWVCLFMSVALILVIVFTILFRCGEIFAMGPEYDCAVGKGWFVFIGALLVTGGISVFQLWRGKRRE